MLNPTDIPAVNHAAPLHDEFCRCRRCKPPLESEARAQRHRLFAAVVTIYGAAFAVALASLVR